MVKNVLVFNFRVGDGDGGRRKGMKGMKRLIK